MTAAATPSQRTSARRTVETLLGLTWSRGMKARFVGAVAMVVLGISAGIQAWRAPIWPSPNDPSLNPGNSPGVTRHGDNLEFSGATPWTGHERSGGRLVLFGDPAEEPDPAQSYVQYRSDRVVVHAPRQDFVLNPRDFEVRSRYVAFAVYVSQAFVFCVLFLFVVRLLLRVRRFDLPIRSQFRLLARAFVPAAVAATVAAIVASQSMAVLLPQFILAGVLAANVLLVTSDPNLRLLSTATTSFQV